MTKTELIKRTVEETGMKEVQVKAMLESLLGIMTKTLNRGEEVRFHNFGVLYPWQQTERPARNPQTGTPVLIAPRVSVKFRPGVLLLKRLNE